MASFKNGKCPVCDTTATAKCRKCGLEAGPFDAALHEGGGDLLIAAEAARRIVDKDPELLKLVNDLRQMRHMRTWASLMTQGIESALRKLRPDAKTVSDRERGFLSQAAQGPMVALPFCNLTREIVDQSWHDLETMARSVGAPRIRRPEIGETDPTFDSADRSAQKVEVKEVPSIADAIKALDTPEGRAWFSKYLEEAGKSAKPAEVAASPAQGDASTMIA